MSKAGAARTAIALAVIATFVLWAHFAAGVPVFRAQVPSTPGWDQFKRAYSVRDFGDDGHFVRAAKNGYNIFFFTPTYAWRFTRKAAAQPGSSTCASCHRAEDMAFAFVNSDRYDARVGKRLSFEERVMRCFAGRLDGFVPTLYDPTIRDLRIFARAIAHHLQLSEGARRDGS